MSKSNSKKKIAICALILIAALAAGAMLNQRIDHKNNSPAQTLRSHGVNSMNLEQKSFSPREYIRIVQRSEQ